MPKVTDEYMANKKRSIADACYRVCLRKPVQMVTMTDVIEESGLSQGGIYRFYKDLDEILSDVVANMREDYNIIDRLDEVTSGAKETFETITYKVCDILAEVMEEHLLDIQKINFDLSVLAINEPERAKKIVGGIQRGRGNFEYLATKTLPLLAKACKEGKQKPKGEPESIMSFIAASYLGIEMTCILAACYGGGDARAQSSPKELFHTLATTIILLFGGEA